MTDRERDLVTTIWFLAVLCAVLLVIIGINLPKIQGDGPEPLSPASPTFQLPPVDSCDTDNPPAPCLEYTP